MSLLIHKLGILSLCAIFLLVQWGCATQPPTLPVELRAQLGKVGVVSARYTPEPDFEGPGTGFSERASGAWEGVKSGAKEGAHKGGSIGSYVLKYTQERGGYWHPGALLLALVSSVVGATVGTIAGGLGGMTMGMIDPAEDKTFDNQSVVRQTLDAYLMELGMQERMRTEVVTVARQNTSHHITELDKEGPAQPESVVSYQHLKEQNIDTVLEVSVRSLGVKSTSSSDRIFSVFLVVRADLRRVGDEAVLYRTHLIHNSSALPLDEWMLNDAVAFWKALDDAYRKLAEQIVTTLL